MTERCEPLALAAIESSGGSGIRSNGVNPGYGGAPKWGTMAFGRTTRPAAGD